MSVGLWLIGARGETVSAPTMEIDFDDFREVPGQRGQPPPLDKGRAYSTTARVVGRLTSHLFRVHARTALHSSSLKLNVLATGITFLCYLGLLVVVMDYIADEFLLCVVPSACLSRPSPEAQSVRQGPTKNQIVRTNSNGFPYVPVTSTPKPKLDVWPIILDGRHHV